MAAWMLGSVVGYAIGVRGGRKPLDHPVHFEKSRRKLLAKGDRAFARYDFVASVTLPAFVSGIFRVRFYIFISGALVAGIGWVGMYVGLSYFFGAEVAKAYRKNRHEGSARRGRDSRHRTRYPSRGVDVALCPASATGVSKALGTTASAGPWPARE